MIDHFQQIKNTFKKTKDFISKNNTKIYSPIWSKMISNNFDKVSLEIIENFRNNEIGRGHDNSYKFKIDKNEFLKELNSDNNLNIFNKYSDLLPNKDENYGNCKNFLIYREKIFDFGTIDQLKFFNIIYDRCFKNNKIEYILEIGSGFGWLARMILKKRKNIKYFIIDLPETNLICNYYLSQSFKDMKIFNFGLMNSNLFDNNKIDEFDIFIFPPFVEIKDIKFDIVINRNSMMEMSKNNIRKYFDLINNFTKPGSFFINQNRYYHDKAGFRNFLHKYPYNKNWNVEYSKPSETSKKIHLLITKKAKISDNSLEKELKKIKNISKAHSPIPIIPLFFINLLRKFKKYLTNRS